MVYLRALLRVNSEFRRSIGKKLNDRGSISMCETVNKALTPSSTFPLDQLVPVDWLLTADWLVKTSWTAGTSRCYACTKPVYFWRATRFTFTAILMGLPLSQCGTGDILISFEVQGGLKIFLSTFGYIWNNLADLCIYLLYHTVIKPDFQSIL